jgi:hypothetical protein
MARMAGERRAGPLVAIRKAVGPYFVSWFVDLSRAVMFWLGVAVTHLLQLLVLQFGWSVTFIHGLDIIEESLVFASAVVFLSSSAISFAWTTYRRTFGEPK